jgi:hypothetical protein
MTKHSGHPQRRAQAVDITCRGGRCNDSPPGLVDDVPQHDDFFDHNLFARPRETGPPSGNDILPRTPTQAPVVAAPTSILAPVVGSPTTASPMTAAPSVNAIKEGTGMESMPLCDVVDGVFGEIAFAEDEVFPYVYQVETTPNTVINQKLLAVIKAMTNQAIVQKIFLDSCSPIGSISIWNRRSIVESIGERRLIRAVGLTSDMKDNLLKYGK